MTNDNDHVLERIHAAIEALHETVKRQHERTGPLGRYLAGRDMWKAGDDAGYSFGQYHKETADEALQINDRSVARESIEHVRRVATMNHNELGGRPGRKMMAHIFSRMCGDKSDDAGYEDISALVLVDLPNDDDNEDAEIIDNLDFTFGQWFLDSVEAYWNEAWIGPLFAADDREFEEISTDEILDRITTTLKLKRHGGGPKKS